MKNFILNRAKSAIKNKIVNKLFLIFFISLGFFSSVQAEIYDYYNSSVNLSASIGERAGAQKIVNLSLQYSQPNNFFSLPGKSNIELLYNMGNKSGIQQYNNMVSGISQDFDFLRLNDIYAGVGVGFYIENKVKDIFDYQFTFGNKIYAGYQFTNNFNAEIFLRHFPKNSLSVNNSSLNIAGISFIVNFE